MDKKDLLKNIENEIERCHICKIGTSGKSVPGEGDSYADIMFVGEAPGKTEAKTGRPFVGRSGQLLRSLIQDTGLKKNGVYITSPVKYLPDRGTPSKKEIEHGMTHLIKQINIINPKVIVLLGNSAIQGVLKEKLPIKKMHGQIVERDGKKYLLAFHPAAGLRFPPLKKLLIDDFRRLKEII